MTSTKHALRFALRSPCEHYRHGAVILRKGKMITGACNLSYKTHPNGSGPLGTCHAEIRAIAKARAILNRNDLGDCKIFVIRINKNGIIKMSKPCDDCMKTIKEHNLSVEWSTGSENDNAAG